MFPPFTEYHEFGSIVVVARSAMGKTKFLCSLVNEGANQHHVLIHSLELSENQLRNMYFCLVEVFYKYFQRNLENTSSAMGKPTERNQEGFRMPRSLQC